MNYVVIKRFIAVNEFDKGRNTIVDENVHLGNCSMHYPNVLHPCRNMNNIDISASVHVTYTSVNKKLSRYIVDKNVHT